MLQKVTAKDHFFPRYFHEKILDLLFVVVVRHRQDWPNSFKPFFGLRCQNWFFTLFCGFFCSHVKTPLKISAIIFHFPSIMRRSLIELIDHFQKVLVIFGNLEFYLIFTFCHFSKFSLFQKISLSPNESRFGLMKFSSLIGCVTKIDINCAKNWSNRLQDTR